MLARVMASNIRAKLCVNLRWLFDDISGLMFPFGLASCVAQCEYSTAARGLALEGPRSPRYACIARQFYE